MLTVCTSDVGTFPWAVVIVGVAGIGGTLLSAHLTSGAAEKRRLAEQQHADRTRFHKERMDVYVRFISATKTYRELLIDLRGRSMIEVVKVYDARAAYAEVREALLLVAEENVARIADKVFGAVTTLEDAKMSDSTFEEWDQIALTSLADFRKAARAELQPA